MDDEWHFNEQTKGVRSYKEFEDEFLQFTAESISLRNVLLFLLLFFSSAKGARKQLGLEVHKTLWVFGKKGLLKMQHVDPGACFLGPKVYLNLPESNWREKFMDLLLQLST
jgi:hypothetical protein